MFSLTEHKSWNGYIVDNRSDSASLATILGAVYVADSVAKSGRNIAAEIRHGNNELMKHITQSTSELTAELQVVEGNLREIGALLDWGFSDIIAENRQMNQTLEDLLKTAKSPSQTWAFEQFDMAREAYSRGLAKEALEYVNNAINGFQGQTGNRLDPRFHFLKGTILLGNKKHHEPDVVNVQAAKQCFEDAARYAVGSNDEETRLFAAEAYCHAAFVAYCLDDMDSVVALCKQAVTIDPQLAESYYLVAKVSSRQGKESATFRSVRKALEIDADYIVKFSTDKDFSNSDVIDQAEEDYIAEQKKRVKTAIDLYRQLKTHTSVDFQEPVTFDIEDGEGILEAGVRISNLRLAGDKVIEAFREGLISNHEKVEKDATRKMSRAETAHTRQRVSPKAFGFLGIIGGFFLGMSAGGIIVALLFAIIGFFVGPIAAGLMNASASNTEIRDAKKAQEMLNQTAEEQPQRFQAALELREQIDRALGFPRLARSVLAHGVPK